MNTRPVLLPVLLLALVLGGAAAAALAHGGIMPPPPPPPTTGSVGPPTTPPSMPGKGQPTGHGGGPSGGPTTAGRASAGAGTGTGIGAGAGGGTTGGGSARGGGVMLGAGSTGFTGATQGPNAWELWWDHNKDPFVMHRAPVRRTSTASARSLASRGRHEVPAGDATEALRPRIVAALRQVLEKEHDSELCDSATLALARVSGADVADAVAPDIRNGLKHDALSVRTSSTLALGVLGASRSLPLLYGLMSDTSAGRAATGGGQVPWNVRAYAAVSLGLINSPLAVEPLLELARSAPASERDVRAAAVTALGLLQGGDLTPVISGLLGIVAAQDVDPVVRASAVTALGHLGDAAVLPTLLKALRLPKLEQVVRQSLVQAVGMLGSVRQAETVTALTLCATKDSDPVTRQFAWIALGQLGGRDDGDALLAQRGELAAFLRQGLRSTTHATDRGWVALAAGLFGAGQPEAARPLLVPLAETYASEKDPSLKSACAIALGLCGADDMAAALVADLGQSKDESLRGYLAVSLGLLGHAEASPALLALCREKALSDTVRQQVASAIAMLGDDSAAPALLAELTATNSLAYASSMSRALGQLRDPRSIEPLIALAQDESQRVVARAFACVSLGLVGDKLDLRFNTRLEQDYNYLAGAATIDEIVGL